MSDGDIATVWGELDRTIAVGSNHRVIPYDLA
jgi:hypothetical protein